MSTRVSVPSWELGPPPPPPQASVSPPCLDPKGGRSNTPLQVRGRGRKPIRTTGKKAWHSVYSVITYTVLRIKINVLECFTVLASRQLRVWSWKHLTTSYVIRLQKFWMRFSFCTMLFSCKVSEIKKSLLRFIRFIHWVLLLKVTVSLRNIIQCSIMGTRFNKTSPSYAPNLSWNKLRNN
jgi:hypothetical protein